MSLMQMVKPDIDSPQLGKNSQYWDIKRPYRTLHVPVLDTMRLLSDEEPRAYVYHPRRRLPPEVYEDNYSYAMNYYQPMLDYIEARNRDEQPAEPPHLPWVCERGYPRYDTKRPISRYPRERVPKLAAGARDLAKHYLPDFRSDVKRSMFSVRQTATATRVEAHLKDVSFLERIETRLRERNAQLAKVLEKERTKRIQHLEKRLKEAYEQTVFDFSPTVKGALRGKNEEQIARILLYDSKTRQVQSNFIHENAVKLYEEQKKKLAQKWPEVYIDKDGCKRTSQTKWVQKNHDNSVGIIREALNDYSRKIKELNEELSPKFIYRF